ncbi:MAG: hypothetical protein LKJ03_07655 [Enterococcaceae bacterium]|nr:hypothetical protein [Enterococcaceae bacterium]
MSKLSNLEEKIKESISGYTILSSRISNDKSLYITFLKEEQQAYCQIRISTHNSKSSFYSNKTFIFYGNDSDILVDQLIDYLKIAPWPKFGYSDFLVLEVIKKRRNGLSFYIDNTFNIFFNNTQGLVIYYEFYCKKNKYVNIASEDWDKVMKKLFSTGLLSYFEESAEILHLYITEGGIKALDYYQEMYISQYRQDYQKIDLHNLILPSLL